MSSADCSLRPLRRISCSPTRMPAAGFNKCLASGRDHTGIEFMCRGCWNPPGRVGTWCAVRLTPGISCPRPLVGRSPCAKRQSANHAMLMRHAAALELLRVCVWGLQQGPERSHNWPGEAHHGTIGMQSGHRWVSGGRASSRRPSTVWKGTSGELRSLTARAGARCQAKDARERGVPGQGASSQHLSACQAALILPREDVWGK